jgi:hypothetical protein
MDFKKEDLIKWALIAAGAYLVYKWMTDSGFLGGGDQAQLPAPAPGAGTGTQTQQQTTTTPPAPTPPAPTPPAPPPGNLETQYSDADMALMTAAYYPAGAAQYGGDTRLNAHQWNWYRARMAEKLGVELDPAIHSPSVDSYANPNLEYTASEYHAILASMGIGGLGMAWGQNFGYQRGWAN